MKLKDMEIAGQEVEVHVSPYGGFNITVAFVEDGEETSRTIASADTLDGTVAKARTVLAKGKVKVNVPFLDTEGRRGHAYSRHAGSGKILVRYDDGETAQLGNYERLLRPDMPQELLDRYLALVDQRNKSRDAAAKIQYEYEVKDFGQTVDAAIDEAKAKQLEGAAA